MESKTFELDGEQYDLVYPIDYLLDWALKAAKDEFKSKESLDQIARVIKAVCPDIPERYFFTANNLTIPLIDTYKLIEFVARLFVVAIERRIGIIESIPERDRVSIKVDINQKINRLRENASQISKQFAEVQFNLILGAVEIHQEKGATPLPSSNGSKLAVLKRQVEELTSEISLLEKT